MKTTNIFAMAALAIVGLSACNNDESAHINFPDESVIRFQVGINDAVSRAPHTTDGNTVKNFGIFISNNDDRYNYKNKEVTGGNGNWTSQGEHLLWHDMSNPVDIIAYSPFKTGNYNSDDNCLIEIETTQTKDSYASDFLYCKKNNFIPERDLTADGKLPLEFNHVLSMLNIEIALGQEFNKPNFLTENPITKLLINNIKTQCNFNFTTGSSVILSSSADINAYCTYFTPTQTEIGHAVVGYQSILIPQARRLSIQIIIDNKIYHWSSQEIINLESGKQYTLHLRLGKELLQIGSVTTTPWDTTTEQNESIETE